MLYAGNGTVLEAIGDGVVERSINLALGDATLANMTVIPPTVFANPDVRLRVSRFPGFSEVDAQVSSCHDFPSS